MFWPGNDARHFASSSVAFVPHMKRIGQIGMESQSTHDKTFEWLVWPCVTLTFDLFTCKRCAPHWRHMESRIMGNLKENITAPHYWPFVSIHRSPVDSPNKGLKCWKRFCVTISSSAPTYYLLYPVYLDPWNHRWSSGRRSFSWLHPASPESHLMRRCS